MIRGARKVSPLFFIFWVPFFVGLNSLKLGRRWLEREKERERERNGESSPRPRISLYFLPHKRQNAGLGKTHTGLEPWYRTIGVGRVPLLG